MVARETKKSVVLTDGDLVDQVEALAKQTVRSFAGMVEFILQEYVKAHESVQESPSMACAGSVGRKSKSASGVGNE